MKRGQTFISKHWQVIVFSLIFLLTLFFRLQAVSHYNVAFTPDQARDMLEIRQMAVTHKPKLLGPVTDIIGLYLGPFWYYFNLLPFLISGGDPLALVYFSIAVLQIISVIVFYCLSQKDKILALFTSCFLLLSPVAFLTTRFAFNANAIFYFTALYPLFFVKPSKTFSFFEGLLDGILLQLEAAVGILFFPISIFVHLRRDRSLRHLSPLFFGFLITLIPQVIFEVTHRFSMTRSFFTEVVGVSSFLGSKMSFVEMIHNRLAHFLSLFANSSYLPLILILTVIVFALIIPSKNHLVKRFLKQNLFIILAFLLFFFLYPFVLKDWYLYGLVPFAVYSFAASVILLGYNRLTRVIPIILFILVIFSSFLENSRYQNNISLHPSNDPSNLRNMLTVIEKVYNSAAGSPFTVYSYLPSVYDYSFQYLFWWYGTKNFGYQPSQISYLPNVPEYIKNNSTYWTKIKPGTTSAEFLIIQHDLANPQRESQWRDRFVKDSRTIITDFPYNITLEQNQILIN